MTGIRDADTGETSLDEAGRSRSKEAYVMPDACMHRVTAKIASGATSKGGKAMKTKVILIPLTGPALADPLHR